MMRNVVLQETSADGQLPTSGKWLQESILPQVLGSLAEDMISTACLRASSSRAHLCRSFVPREF